MTIVGFLGFSEFNSTPGRPPKARISGARKSAVHLNVGKCETDSNAFPSKKLWFPKKNKNVSLCISYTNDY